MNGKILDNPRIEFKFGCPEGRENE